MTPGSFDLFRKELPPTPLILPPSKEIEEYCSLTDATIRSSLVKEAASLLPYSILLALLGSSEAFEDLLPGELTSLPLLPQQVVIVLGLELAQDYYIDDFIINITGGHGQRDNNGRQCSHDVSIQ